MRQTFGRSAGRPYPPGLFHWRGVYISPTRHPDRSGGISFALDSYLVIHATGFHVIPVPQVDPVP